METKIEKDVRFLKMYAIAATVLCGVLLLTAFTRNSNQKFEEIDVERINIVEKDGALKMVISNETRQHPGIVNGKIIQRSYPRPPGIIFFNQLGDEMGGLAFGENGKNGHWGGVTFDKVRGDQTIGFRHMEGIDGSYWAGMQVWQQPNIPGDEMLAKRDSARNIKDERQRKEALKYLKDNNLLTQQRLFLGKSRSDAAVLEMNDIKGNTRIVLMVDAAGMPTLQFLSENGDVIYKIPEDNKNVN